MFGSAVAVGKVSKKAVAPLNILDQLLVDAVFTSHVLTSCSKLVAP